MNFRLIIVVILTIAQSYAMAQSTGMQGSDYLIEEQYGRAKSWYIEKLKKKPEDVSALVGLGNTYMALNNIDSAGIVFQKATTLDLKNPFAWTGMGKVALVKNDLRGVADYLERARRADKTNPEVYCAIAEACISCQVQDTALAYIYLNQGMLFNPKYACLHLSAGNLALVKKKYGEAVNAYERAIFFDPGSALAYRKLGYARYLLRNYKDALSAFNKSLEINQEQIQVYKDLGNLYYATGKFAEAVSAYQAYMSRTEITMDDKERFAILLFFNRRYKEASELLEQVLTVSKNESVLLRLEAYIAYETGEYQKGLESMKKFFSLHNPEKIIQTDYIYFARILTKTGNDSLAMVSFQKAIALDPAKTEIYEELAKLAAKNNLHADAAENYRKMGEKGADKTVTTFLAGKEYYFEGNKWKMRYDSLSHIQKKSRVPFSDSLAVRESMKLNYIRADSAFTLVTQLNSDYAGGYLWKGRVQAILFPEADNNGARDAYEKALLLLQKGDQESNKKMIIECYRYLGYYYFRDYERLYKTNKQKAAESRTRSIEYFTKIIRLDPSDRQANDVIKKMNQT